MSRGMQNLTARYNYIYNSNLILDNYEESLSDTYKDNYNEILPVYTTPEKFNPAAAPVPPLNERDLEKIIDKAQAIVADKAFSNYIDDAYLLLGRAHFYKTNYFIAEEYFDYTAKTYPANPNVLVSALNWKARSLMQLNNLKDAALILDTVYLSLPGIKKNKAEPLATIAQMYIYQERYGDAILMLNNAIQATSLKRNRIRWTYILGQVYEKQKNYSDALACYQKVQKSNARFELYFNANLSRIKLTGLLKGEQSNRTNQLLALLKDDKNAEYIDQVYYQVAESHADDSRFTEAEKYYNLSIRNSNNAGFQRGLSYLRLADLNFREFRNFLKAKLYYDSTVNTLPKNYPGYAQIVKKSENLEYITKRYDAIAFQDILQMLAKMPEADRNAKIEQIVLRNKSLAEQTAKLEAAALLPTSQTSNTIGSGAFYFSNSNAMAKGYKDFLTRWGNRRLEDDWRQSIKSSSQATTAGIVKAETSAGSTEQGMNGGTAAATDNQASKYSSAVPLTPAQLDASNEQILNALYEIAGFYQQVLDDQKEAIRIYQEILTRYPSNQRLAPIYYSLYLGYGSYDQDNALKYKKLVLEQFPSSVYAKTILDPQYSVRQSELEAKVLGAYNQVFSLYERKAFPQVITAVNSNNREYPNSLVAPQLGYLKAISIGRTQPVDSLVTAFNTIISDYPADLVIVPLVKDHLAYIAAHRNEFSKRKVALPDFDINEPRFFASQPLSEKSPAVPFVAPVVKTPAVQLNVPPAPAVRANPIPVAGPPIFSDAVSATYYYVIDVEDASLTLSSSRFGIGQFNRGNYPDARLRHQLIEFDNDQLIYVGNFSSFAEAKSYADGITPQLGLIMKVPAGIYSSFIITKENFEKLRSKELLTKYLDFYKNNYQK